MTEILGTLRQQKLEVCLDSIRTPGPLRETSGPTYLTLGAVPNGYVLARHGDQLVGVAPWASQPETVHVSPSGSDSAAGTSDAPIQSLRELAKRVPLLGERVRVFLAAGDYQLFDWWGAAMPESRTSFGSERSFLEFIGTQSVVESFTVESSAGITLTAAGSPGWGVNEHRNRWVPITNFLNVFYHPILANTADTITLNIAPTSVGGPFSMPVPGTELSIVDAASRIIPPATNPTFAANRFHFRGSLSAFAVDFDGGGSAFSGPTAMHDGAQYTFNACRFRRFSGRGLEAKGYGFVSGCVFDGCSEASLEVSGGFCQVNDTFVRNTQTGYRAAFGGAINQGAFSILAMQDVGEECWNGKSRSICNDESIRVWLDNVRDYAFLQRGSAFFKVNAPLVRIPGTASPTRNVARLVGGNLVELFDTPNQNLSPGGAYLRLNGIEVGLSDYSANGRAVEDVYGNSVHDVTALGG